MMDRRRAVRFALAALAAAWLIPSSAARAESALKRLHPFLIDLDGWQGKKPGGMSMDMGDESTTTATRDYQRGASQIHVSISVGPGAAAAGVLPLVIRGMNIGTSDGDMDSTTSNALKAAKSDTIEDKSGAITFALGDQAAFCFSYNCVTFDGAAQLAKKFDLTAVQAAVAQK